MNKLCKSLCLFLLLSCAMVGTAVPTHADTELNFGIISTDSSAALKQAWQPFIDDLSRETGLKVTPFFASDYAGIIEAMRFNKVQFGVQFKNVGKINVTNSSN